MSTKTKKEEGGGANRLHDIEVEEVSLVDRPANKRTFLVMKRAEVRMATGAEVIRGGDGGFTTATDKAKDDPKKKPGAPPPSADGAAATNKDGGALTLAPDVKSALSSILQDAMTQLSSIAEAVANAAEGTPDAASGDLPPDVEEAIEGVASMLLDVTEQGDAPAAGAAEAAQAAPPPQTPAAVAMRLGFEKRRLFTKAVRDVAAISKVGAKMSKDRLTRFDQALTTLRSILNELTPEVAASTPASPVSGDKRDATTKRDLAKDPLLVALEKRVTTAEAVARAASDELARIRKGRPGSNGLVIDNDRQPLAKSEPNPWRMDMASQDGRADHSDNFGTDS